MSFLTHLECFRCGEAYPPERSFWGCPACTGEKASNLFCVYDYEGIRKAWSPAVLATRPASLWRYREFMPVDEASIVTSARHPRRRAAGHTAPVRPATSVAALPFQCP